VTKITLIVLIALVACFATGCQQEFGFKNLSPATGAISGGEAVVINGSGFETSMGLTIYFGTEKALNVVVTGPETMTVTTPSVPETKVVDVRILTDTGKEFILRNAFRFISKANIDIRELGQRKSMREQKK
jgi:hypothetical protein